MRLLLTVLLCVAGCGASPTETSPIDGATTPASAEPAASDGAADALPREEVPAKLREVAKSYGLTMLDTWSWTETDREKSRFDWSGKPHGGEHEVLWSFWVKGEDMKLMRPFLPQTVQTAAMNLTREDTCEPFDQPAEIVAMLGADRIITVCFVPAPFMTDKYKSGVMHGLVHGDALTIVVVLRNDHTGTIPMPDDIGGRF